MIYMVMKVLGAVIMTSSTPYSTIEDCEASLEVLRVVPELNTEYLCSTTRPEIDELTPDQRAKINAWVTRQR